MKLIEYIWLNGLFELDRMLNAGGMVLDTGCLVLDAGHWIPFDGLWQKIIRKAILTNALIGIVGNLGRLQNLALVIGGRVSGFFDDDAVVPRDLVLF